MERYDRTIIIPIKLEDDKILCLDGQPLPKLSKRTVGNLVIPSVFLKDIEDQQKFSQEEKKLAFKKGEELYFEINPKLNSNSSDLGNDFFQMKNPSKCFVKILLMGDLYLKSRFQKKAKFESCKCYIPCLDKTAESLNHAYTLISQKYESTRRSHTGNVFNICYFIDKDNLRILDIKREILFNY